MTITPHLLAGTALAAQTDSLIVAFLLGLVIHFVLDAIPHVDPGTFLDDHQPHKNRNLNMDTVHQNEKPWPTWVYVFVAVEALVMLGVLFSFRGRNDFLILLFGAAGALFIDVLDSPPFRFILKIPVLKQLHWLHHRIHFDLDKRIWYGGLPVEIIIILISLWVLYK